MEITEIKPKGAKTDMQRTEATSPIAQNRAASLPSKVHHLNYPGKMPGNSNHPTTHSCPQANLKNKQMPLISFHLPLTPSRAGGHPEAPAMKPEWSSLSLPTQPLPEQSRAGGLMAKSGAGWSEPSRSPKATLSASGDSLLRPSEKGCAELHPIRTKQISSLAAKGSGQLSRAQWQGAVITRPR